MFRRVRFGGLGFAGVNLRGRFGRGFRHPRRLRRRRRGLLGTLSGTLNIHLDVLPLALFFLLLRFLGFVIVFATPVWFRARPQPASFARKPPEASAAVLVAPRGDESGIPPRGFSPPAAARWRWSVTARAAGCIIASSANSAFAA